MLVKRTVTAISLIAVILVMVFALTGCLGNIKIPPQGTPSGTPPQYTPGTEPNQKMLTYSEELFNIKYPDTWSIENKEAHKVNVIFRAPGSGGSDNEFLPTVSIYAVNLTDSDKDFNKYTDSVVEDLKSKYENFELISRDPYKISDFNCTALVYKAQLSGYNIESRQIIGESSGKIYIITYMSDKGTFDAYLKTADKIINSFVLNS